VRSSPLFVPLAPFAIVASLAALTACGGSSAAITSAAGSVGTPSEDGSAPDANASEAASDDGGQPPTEASTSDDAGKDAGSCADLATRKTCVACCDTTFAAGLAVFDSDIQVCACQASLCGPIDAGSGDAGEGSDGGSEGGSAADAGDYGVGACAASCGTTTAPNAACEKCFLETLGTAAAPGECRASVASACASSAACKRYVACTDSCPAK
jgi:hypothetical protein